MPPQEPWIGRRPINTPTIIALKARKKIVIVNKKVAICRLFTRRSHQARYFRPQHLNL